MEILDDVYTLMGVNSLRIIKTLHDFRNRLTILTNRSMEGLSKSKHESFFEAWGLI